MVGGKRAPQCTLRFVYMQSLSSQPRATVKHYARGLLLDFAYVKDAPACSCLAQQQSPAIASPVLAQLACLSESPGGTY